MKKFLLLLLLAVVTGKSAWSAEYITINEITYYINKDEACALKASKLARTFEVIHFVDSIKYKGKSYPVTELRVPLGGVWIGSVNSNLLEVSIPNTVKTINICVFDGCINLRTVIVPDYPIKIFTYKNSNGQLKMNSAFRKCNSITTVKCQNGSFPLWITSHLPEDCPFMLAQKYQQPANNNNMYAQNVQQPAMQTTPVVPKAEKKAPSSDVDINLPTTAENNDKTFVVIFANENYQEVADVEYALNDGEIFKNYCKSVLGIPENNIQLRKNATKNNMVTDLTWIKDVAEAYNGEAKFIVFYAGHGIPDEKSNETYLLPVDGIAQNLTILF